MTTDYERPYPIVTVTPTIQDGTVVRWFTSEHWLATGHAVMSASRRCVRIEVVEIRTSADYYRLLAAVEHGMTVQGQMLNGENVDHLATHSKMGLTGPHLPLAADGSGAAK